ncbi:MAG TPA: Rieske 2Fe-2S domain-containing protein, partial [Streptosporangiaceae bacterium]|nr:Rieske 2Fe-2S domain-containing protein [Streptosporangiaceae bacterium]
MDQVRTIDAGAPPARFARGWHCLGLAGRFRDGGPHAVQAFGTKLVVFADSSGALHVLDSYCRHMGGDLSQGTVKGDAIACPFHDWRWGGDGRCAAIPYARRVPVAARTRAWRTLVRNGQLFVWHDPEGGAPPDDVTIPVIEGVGSPEWTSWTWDSILVEGANCREVIDNVVDMAHFFYIHFAFPTYFRNVFEGHIASQYLRTRSRPDVGGASNYSSGGETTLRSEASYYGPAYMIDNLWHDYHGMTMESVLINCHYPVTPN